MSRTVMEHDQFMEEIFRRMEHLPPGEQLSQMLLLIECALRQMSHDTVRNYREAIVARGHMDDSATEELLNLIDGHLALRELTGDTGPALE